MILDALVQSSSISEREKLERISRFNFIISNVKSAGKSNQNTIKTKSGKTNSKLIKAKRSAKSKARQQNTEEIYSDNDNDAREGEFENLTRKANGEAGYQTGIAKRGLKSRNDYPEVNGPPVKTLKKRPGSAQRP